MLITMYYSGEQPGKGRYRCVKCGYEIQLDSDAQQLPSCPKCGAIKWEKI